ncbi:MAG: prepilin-type N-terminal cleavage/methylation domain-containing protein [Bacillota bacterium]|nr:prepilin-type N-terminal cleavage/methylation domain-containing protein [Bacillota bacterium]MDW7728831.1 prepilin-type N-terminal cleavage/methylation domain-containing protein [Bacillota bacterium]
MAGCEKGLTLIELLVTFAILGFILAATYSFYFAGLNSWHRSIDRIDCSQNARIAMDKMIRELRYASEIAIHDHGREIRFKAPHDSKRTLRFRLVGRELVFDSFPTGSTYYFNNKIALEISELYFLIDQSGLVRIKIRTGNNGSAVLLSGAVYPRNLISESTTGSEYIN